MPILIKKSLIAEHTVNNLLKDHLIILKKFQEFETIDDYNLSIQKMNDLMKGLSIHAKKEEDFFSTIKLTITEEAIIEEVVKSIGTDFDSN